MSSGCFRAITSSLRSRRSDSHVRAARRRARRREPFTRRDHAARRRVRPRGDASRRGNHDIAADGNCRWNFSPSRAPPRSERHNIARPRHLAPKFAAKRCGFRRRGRAWRSFAQGVREGKWALLLRRGRRCRAEGVTDEGSRDLVGTSRNLIRPRFARLRSPPVEKDARSFVENPMKQPWLKFSLPTGAPIRLAHVFAGRAGCGSRCFA